MHLIFKFIFISIITIAYQVRVNFMNDELFLWASIIIYFAAWYKIIIEFKLYIQIIHVVICPFDSILFLFMSDVDFCAVECTFGVCRVWLNKYVFAKDVNLLSMSALYIL